MTRRSSSAIPAEFSHRLLFSTTKEAQQMAGPQAKPTMDRTGDFLGLDQAARFRTAGEVPTQPAMGAMEEGVSLALVNLGYWQPVAAKALASPGQDGVWGVRDDIPRSVVGAREIVTMAWVPVWSLSKFQRSADRMLKSIRKFSLTHIETYWAGLNSIFCWVTSSGVNSGCAKCSLGFCRRR